jgi:outer membrane receptor protein involved in Fe transport
MLTLCLVVALAGQARGQDTMGVIRGTVRDVQGAAIPGASVSIACMLSPTRQVATNAFGEFVTDGLPLGRCSVSAEAPGFTTTTASIDATASAMVALTLPVKGFATSVVVTPARGLRESTFDVPSAVSVVQRAEIESRPYTLLPQVLREEPGILVQQTTTAQASPIIRGFTGQQNAYLIDGVRLNTAAWRSGPSQYFAWIDSGAVDRLEIVRGPGSVEYGSDALGGTVNVLPAVPALSGGGIRLGGSLDMNLASADRAAGTQGALTIQASGASLRFGASTQQVGDLRGGRGVDSHAAVTRFLGLPSTMRGNRMAATKFDQTGVYLVGAIRAGSSGSIKTVYLQDRQTGASRYDRIDGGDGAYRSGFDPQRLDFLLLRYRRTGAAFFDDWSGSFSINRQDDGRFEQVRPTAVLDRQAATTTALGYQLEGHRHFGARHQVGVGTEIYDESMGAFREQVTPATGVAVPNRPDIPDGTQYVNVGVYVNDTAVIVPGRVTARAGLRYGRFRFSTPVDPALRVADEQVTMQALTFNTGLLVAVTPKLNATFIVARGFRAPNAADLGNIGLTGGGGFEITPSRAADLGGLVGTTGAAGAVSAGERVPALGPEVVYSFEPGLKFQTDRVSAMFAAYDMELRDSIQRRAIVFDTNVVGATIAGFQIVRQDATGLAYIAQDIRPIATSVNAGRGRIRGFDAEAAVQVTAAWRARVYFSMTRGTLLGTGESLRRMPPPMGGASARWTGSRVWIEATTAFAAAQTRFNSGDLTDARIGGTRTRASIANYFNGTAADLGLVRNGILLETGETLAQVQQRVLGNADSAPMFDQAAGFLVFGLRGNVRLSSAVNLTVIGENLTDRNYRLYGSGTDSPGANVQVRLRCAF